MALDIHEITDYKYSLWSTKQDDKANVICQAVGGHVISLQFKGGTASLPLPVKAGGGNPGQNTYILYFRYSDMPNVIDMLRNEKPVYMKYASGTPVQARISTDSGPLI